MRLLVLVLPLVAAVAVNEQEADPNRWLEAGRANERKAKAFRHDTRKLEALVAKEHEKTEAAYTRLSHAYEPIEHAIAPPPVTGADPAAEETKALRAEEEAGRNLDDAVHAVKAAAQKALRGAREKGERAGAALEAQAVLEEVGDWRKDLQTQALDAKAQDKELDAAFTARLTKAEQQADKEELELQAERSKAAQLRSRDAEDEVELANATQEVAAVEQKAWPAEESSIGSVTVEVVNATNTWRSASAVQAARSSAQKEVAHLRSQAAQRMQKRMAAERAVAAEKELETEVSNEQAALRVTDSQLSASRQAEEEMVEKLQQIREASEKVSATLAMESKAKKQARARAEDDTPLGVNPNAPVETALPALDLD